MADQDGDGSIDKEEMKDLFRAAGAVDVTETDMDDIFYQADANGNGVIDPEELLDALTSGKTIHDHSDEKFG